MGKSRNKNHSSLVHELKRENTRLRKEVEKLKAQLENINEPTYEEFEELSTWSFKEEHKKCPDCFNVINITPLGNKELITCNNCGYRKTRKL